MKFKLKYMLSTALMSASLFAAENAADEEIAESELRKIACDLNHEHNRDALWDLTRSSNAEYKEFADSALRKIAWDQNDPQNEQVIRYFWEDVTLWNYTPEYEKRREFVRIIAQTPPYNWNAIRYLLSDLRNESYTDYEKEVEKKNFDVAFPLLRRIVMDLNHSHCWDAIERLRYSVNEEDKKVAYKQTTLIAQDFNHPYNVSAIDHLWGCNEEAHNEIARVQLGIMAQKPLHLFNFWAAEKLYYDGNEQDKTIAYQGLRIIGDTVENEDMRQYRQRRDSYTNIKRPSNQFEAIRKLRESNDPEDQRIGLALKLKYFPVVLEDETVAHQAQFNMDEIRATMPAPLVDLSANPMNIVTEIQRLMELMSPHEKSDGGDNPYYVSPRLIDGDASVLDTASVHEKQEFLTRLKNRASGFFKTLDGQVPLEHETSGWQMYEENKADMINSVKHIVIVLDSLLAGDTEKHDEAMIQRAMSSLGIVLNGILNCQTGQAEGIESAVNFLIRGVNAASSDLKELVSKHVVSSAVKKAFNNAFHQGGGVHGIARARMTLANELGMHHAIGGFRERISPVSDEEIPEFYNKFYARFNLHFILEEARRNIQTAEESVAVTNALTPEERANAKKIKMNKPLSVAQILNWLCSHGEQERLHDRFGISEDFTVISDLGLINVLVKMNYLREDSAVLKDYVTVLRNREILEEQDRAYEESLNVDQQGESSVAPAHGATEEHIAQRVQLTPEEVRAARLAVMDKK